MRSGVTGARSQECPGVRRVSLDDRTGISLSRSREWDSLGRRPARLMDSLLAFIELLSRAFDSLFFPISP